MELEKQKQQIAKYTERKIQCDPNWKGKRRYLVASYAFPSLPYFGLLELNHFPWFCRSILGMMERNSRYICVLLVQQLLLLLLLLPTVKTPTFCFLIYQVLMMPSGRLIMILIKCNLLTPLCFDDSPFGPSK